MIQVPFSTEQQKALQPFWQTNGGHVSMEDRNTRYVWRMLTFASSINGHDSLIALQNHLGCCTSQIF